MRPPRLEVALLQQNQGRVLISAGQPPAPLGRIPQADVELAFRHGVRDVAVDDFIPPPHLDLVHGNDLVSGCILDRPAAAGVWLGHPAAVPVNKAAELVARVPRNLLDPQIQAFVADLLEYNRNRLLRFL